MKTAYTGDHESSLEKFLLAQDQGFFIMLKFGDYVTAYAYTNKTQTCLGLLLVHHAVSKALTSRAPYVSQGAVRGKENVKDNSMAAVTGLFLHAVMMTVRGKTHNFEPTTTMLGNPVTAYAMIQYCLKRWHQWDSRVAVMFGKAMLASDTDLLSSKFGLEANYRNRSERGLAGFSKADKIALLLSVAGDNNDSLRKALEVLKKNGEVNDIFRRQTQIAVVMSCLENALHKDGYLYRELLGCVEREIDIGQRNAAQDTDAKKEALDAELGKLKAFDKGSGDKEGEHADLGKKSTKPKRKKKAN